jgi:site-specific DNA-methyltransferase (adenine-specific)
MLGDCLERMKELPDGSVDMVLTDIPYGEVNRTAKGVNGKANSEGGYGFLIRELLIPAISILRSC